MVSQIKSILCPFSLTICRKKSIIDEKSPLCRQPQRKMAMKGITCSILAQEKEPKRFRFAGRFCR